MEAELYLCISMRQVSRRRNAFLDDGLDDDLFLA
jgi:hypothetical protein